MPGVTEIPFTEVHGWMTWKNYYYSCWANTSQRYYIIYGIGGNKAIAKQDTPRNVPGVGTSKSKRIETNLIKLSYESNDVSPNAWEGG